MSSSSGRNYIDYGLSSFANVLIKNLDWFYYEDLNSGNNKHNIMISDDEHRHIKVKRLNENDQLCLFNGKSLVELSPSQRHYKSHGNLEKNQ